MSYEGDMMKSTKDDKIGVSLLTIDIIFGIFYIWLHQTISCSQYGFEIVSFYCGAIWCLLMIIAIRKLKIFEKQKP